MPKAILGIRPNLTIEVEGDDKTLITALAFWDSVPHECPKCQSQLRFTLRTPKAKGKTVRYYGLLCDGHSPHEAQISERMAENGGGFFIYEGNRSDGKPNWRDAYGYRDDEPDHDSYEEEQSNRAPEHSAPSSQRNPNLANDDQLKEIRRVARLQGFSDDAAIDEHCGNTTAFKGKGFRELTKGEAIEYRKMLLAL